MNMDKIFLSTLIASIITLFGFFINLYISKKTRNSFRSLENFKNILSFWSESVSDFKNFIKEVEHVRISCWDLLSKIKTIQDLNHSSDSLKEFESSYHSFTSNLILYNDRWLSIKSDSLDIDLEDVRKTRHSCRKRIEELERNIHKLYDNKNNIKLFDSFLTEIENSIKVLLELFDFLIKISISKRNEILANKIIDEKSF
jgi:hypothetical protein